MTAAAEPRSRALGADHRPASQEPAARARKRWLRRALIASAAAAVVAALAYGFTPRPAPVEAAVVHEPHLPGPGRFGDVEAAEVVEAELVEAADVVEAPEVAEVAEVAEVVEAPEAAEVVEVGDLVWFSAYRSRGLSHQKGIAVLRPDYFVFLPTEAAFNTLTRVAGGMAGELAGVRVLACSPFRPCSVCPWEGITPLP